LFRTGIGNDYLSYGAAYYPYLRTTLVPYIIEKDIQVTGGTVPAGSVLKLDANDPLSQLGKSAYHTNNILYQEIKKSIEKNNVVLSPASAVAGVFC
jgi:uncharacterized protein